jgi:hypothetical protein
VLFFLLYHISFQREAKHTSKLRQILPQKNLRDRLLWIESMQEAVKWQDGSMSYGMYVLYTPSSSIEPSWSPAAEGIPNPGLPPHTPYLGYAGRTSPQDSDRSLFSRTTFSLASDQIL